MKSILLALTLIAITPSAFAKCVVEILDEQGDPLGYVFQGDSCAEPKARCQRELSRLNNSHAKCEVTLDIGSKTDGKKLLDVKVQPAIN